MMTRRRKKTNKMFSFLCKLFMYLPPRYFEMKRKQRDIFSKETFPKKSKKSIENFWKSVICSWELISGKLKELNKIGSLI